jgi:hypothetical protein
MTTQARRLARWLRLVVTCLAFVLGSPTPAIAVEPLDQIVLVTEAEDEPREEARAESPKASVGTCVESAIAAESVESPVLVSRRYLTNCALLL